MEYLSGNQEKIARLWIKKTAKVAEKALCLRARCGALIIKDNKIIGKGYNGPPLDNLKNRMCLKEYKLPQKFKYDRTCCVHAEWRAITNALKNFPIKIDGSSLYFTRINEDIKQWGKPFCTVCSRLILDIGIKYVILPQEKGLCKYDSDEYNRFSYNYHI